MAKFVRLHRDNDGGEIDVNLDQVVFIEKTTATYTFIRFANVAGTDPIMGITVKETPDQIFAADGRSF